MPDGFLVLDKPRGWTSREAVDRVVAILNTRRVGHAGTLDPLATGVLVICVGKATRLTRFLHETDKEYHAVFRLGVTSPTDDADGPVTEVPNAPVPTAPEIEECLQGFLGVIEQKPPAYSAIKVAGRRAYDLAREGAELDLRPREVTIYTLKAVRYEYPWLELAITCGTGTYVRALGRDLGEKLGCGAVMYSLNRLRVGPFRLEQAVKPEALTPETAAANLRPMSEGVAHLPRAIVEPPELCLLLRGLKIRCPESLPDVESGQKVAVFNRNGELASVAMKTAGGFLRPIVNLLEPSST